MVSEAVCDCPIAIESQSWNAPIPRMERSDPVNERNPFFDQLWEVGILIPPPAEGHSLAVIAIM